MSFKPYPKYKESGVEWLGRVPEHWEVRRLGFHFDERREKVSDKDYPPLSVTKNGIVSQLETAAKTDDGDNRKLVRAGDFVINSRSDRKGSAGVSEADGSVSLICTVLSPRTSVRPSFAHHLLRSVPFQEEYYRYGKGIVADLWSTNFGEMRNILLALPPLQEQASIATFLDHETAKIDALIAEQQRLIELLQEKRQAVISHVVTKGLNPDAPMKDSRIEWLGEVPEHWGTTKVKFVTALTADCPHETPEYSEDGEYLVIRTADVTEGRLRESQMYRLAEPQYLRRIRRVPLDAGDVVYTREGERWGLAALVPLSGRFCLGQRMFQMRARPDFCGAFLMWHLTARCVYAQAEVDTIGATAPHVNLSSIINFEIVDPPLNEQRLISGFLEAETSAMDCMVVEAERAISLLQERRSALISAAVTGQIDVRDFAGGSEAA